MNPEHSPDWVSAFLDGELPSEQRADAARRLGLPIPAPPAESTAAQRPDSPLSIAPTNNLLENAGLAQEGQAQEGLANAVSDLRDFNELGHRLRELPRLRLPEDFAARVLRMAEREILAGPAAPAAAISSSESATRPSTAASPHSSTTLLDRQAAEWVAQSRALRRWRLAFAGAASTAVAACIVAVISLGYPLSPRQTAVARYSSPRTDSIAAPAAPSGAFGVPPMTPPMTPPMGGYNAGPMTGPLGMMDDLETPAASPAAMASPSAESGDVATLRAAPGAPTDAGYNRMGRAAGMGAGMAVAPTPSPPAGSSPMAESAADQPPQNADRQRLATKALPPQTPAADKAAIERKRAEPTEPKFGTPRGAVSKAEETRAENAKAQNATVLDAKARDAVDGDAVAGDAKPDASLAFSGILRVSFPSDLASDDAWLSAIQASPSKARALSKPTSDNAASTASAAPQAAAPQAAAPQAATSPQSANGSRLPPFEVHLLKLRGDQLTEIMRKWRELGAEIHWDRTLTADETPDVRERSSAPSALPRSVLLYRASDISAVTLRRAAGAAESQTATKNAPPVEARIANDQVMQIMAIVDFALPAK
jgi:hypothetical protein